MFGTVSGRGRWKVGARRGSRGRAFRRRDEGLVHRGLTVDALGVHGVELDRDLAGAVTSDAGVVALSEIDPPGLWTTLYLVARVRMTVQKSTGPPYIPLAIGSFSSSVGFSLRSKAGVTGIVASGASRPTAGHGKAPSPGVPRAESPTTRRSLRRVVTKGPSADRPFVGRETCRRTPEALPQREVTSARGHAGSPCLLRDRTQAAPSRLRP